MSKPPKQRTPEFKLKLVLEALKGDKSIAQLASGNGMHPKQIQRWKNQLLEEGENIFLHKTTQKQSDPDKEINQKYENLKNWVNFTTQANKENFPNSNEWSELMEELASEPQVLKSSESSL